MKIVVFDLDETLGYFTEFGIFWDSLSNYLKIKEKPKLNQDDFNETLDLYPEFLRPNIINILKYLKEKKKSNCCQKMMIYTNNNGSYEWLQNIINYFEKKIEYKLIDQVIRAFKINGKIIEICRTSHDKSHKDFIKCTRLPLTAEICFLDDIFHPKMLNENIYYINIKPYYYDLKFDYLLMKFRVSEIGKRIIENDSEFENIMMKHIKMYNYEYIEKNLKEYEIDKILGKHIISHLNVFFNKSKKNKTLRKTRKNNKRNKTSKYL
jgi:hypothetical protein